MIQAPTLAAFDGVQHRFFTRRGGVSSGLFSSLNCGYGSADAPDNVRENRRRVAEQFGLGEPDLQTVHQIHSTDVLTVGRDRWRSPGAPKADGLVTDRPGVVLGVLAADCAPVLLADGDAGVIGAAPNPRACHAHLFIPDPLRGVKSSGAAACEGRGLAAQKRAKASSNPESAPNAP